VVERDVDAGVDLHDFHAVPDRFGVVRERREVPPVDGVERDGLLLEGELRRLADPERARRERPVVVVRVDLAVAVGTDGHVSELVPAVLSVPDTWTPVVLDRRIADDVPAAVGVQSEPRSVVVRGVDPGELAAIHVRQECDPVSPVLDGSDPLGSHRFGLG